MRVPTESASGSADRQADVLDGLGVDHSNHIAGEWRVPRGGEAKVTSPATGEKLATIGLSSPEDVDDAVRGARTSFEGGQWRRTGLRDRAQLFERVADIVRSRRDEIALLESLDSGGTLRRTLADPLSRYFRDVAEQLRRFDDEVALPYASRPVPSFNLVRREPIGVCGLITPWNYPAIMAAFKLGPSLAMGNSVVLKPAVEAPLSTIRLVEAFLEAGLPPDVINLVQGDGVPVGEHLVAHPDVDKIAFTGSTEVGRRVMELASRTIKNITLELGGKSPNLLLADADLEQALKASLFAVFLHSGQICVSGSRLLVPEPLQDEVTSRLADLATGLRVGDPVDRATDMGPLISARQLERVRRLVDGAVREGASIAVGGDAPELPDHLRGGSFIEPTIVTGVSNEMEIAREEVFGPVLAVISYRDVGEAVKLANDTEYGLAAGVWSKDVPRAIEVARGLRAGTVWVNEWHMLRHDAPYGGYKQSGIGREHGEIGFEQYVEHKHIHVSVAPTNYQILFGNENG